MSDMRAVCFSVSVWLFFLLSASGENLPEGVRRVKVLSYPDCFELSNDETRVTLGHHVGGRVLEYIFLGRNALYLDPKEAQWSESGDSRKIASAGRFDIGPEYLIPKREKLWTGEWQAEAIGPRGVRLTSQIDEATGVQLIREFRLSAKGTHLSCEQIRWL